MIRQRHLEQSSWLFIWTERTPVSMIFVPICIIGQRGKNKYACKTVMKSASIKKIECWLLPRHIVSAPATCVARIGHKAFWEIGILNKHKNSCYTKKINFFKCDRKKRNKEKNNIILRKTKHDVDSDSDMKRWMWSSRSTWYWQSFWCLSKSIFFFLNLWASWAYITIHDCTTSSITTDHVSFKIKCKTLVRVRWGFFQEYLSLYHSLGVGDNNEYNFHLFVFWLQDWSKHFHFATHNGHSLCRIGKY